MKNNTSLTTSILLLFLILLMFGLSGCACSNGTFTVYGHENNYDFLENKLNTTEDIKNLVTDDDKLVINYYNAYTWVVFFGDTGNIEHMIYIYSYDSESDAMSLVDDRVKELDLNSTMKIQASKVIDSYVAIDLTDSSFTNVTRSMLEHNFSMLIVY